MLSFTPPESLETDERKGRKRKKRDTEEEGLLATNFIKRNIEVCSS